MSYTVEVYPEAASQIRALPEYALLELAEAMTVLELTPWAGVPYNAANPTGGMRQLLFGAHVSVLVVYLILEEQARVDVLRVLWLE